MLSVTLARDVIPEGLAAPGLAWTGTTGDFARAASGGLSGGDPIRTAILMLLFTDAKAERRDLRAEHNGDARGWVGDAVGDDGSLGSTLWLLRREVLNSEIARRAEAEAVRALQPLIRQGIAVRAEATARIAGAGDRLELSVTLVRRDGLPVFSDRFDVLWKVG